MRQDHRQNTTSEHSLVAQKLALPATLEDGKAPVLSVYFSYIASTLILALIVWGSIAEMREFANAPGEIVPSGAVKLIHHLEGGQIENVLVKEGQLVREGAPIVTLRPIIAESDLTQLEARRGHLRLKLRKYDALINDKPFQMGRSEDPKLFAVELEAYSRETRRLARAQETITARTSQRRAEATALARELKSLIRRQKIAKEQLKIQSDLIVNGYTSRRAYLDAKAHLEELNGQVIATRGRLEAAKEQIVEANSAFKQALADAVAEYSVETSKLSGELIELDQEIKKHRDRVERLVIKASADGVIHELEHRSPGEVARAGDLIAKIVPIDKDIVAEVQLQPRDIGHIKVGDRAELSISTYDPNVFGAVGGTLERVSPSSFRDDLKSPPYFKAVIRLDKPHVGRGQQQVPILPGMVVDAKIITGSKSLVRYFLRPIYRSWNRSLSER